jgi:hypothetical protein
MPVPISNDTKLTLAGYAPTRNGHYISITNTGTIFQYACWNWTLSGGQLTVNDPKSAPSIVDDLIQFDWENKERIFANGVNAVPPGKYPECDADLKIMRDQLKEARTVRANPNTQFTDAYLGTWFNK